MASYYYRDATPANPVPNSSQADREALPDPAQVSDDAAQRAAGDAVLGIGAEIAARPETDLGNALYEFGRGEARLIDVLVCAFDDATTHGTRRPSLDDELAFLHLLGVTIAEAAAKLAPLVAALVK